MGPTIPSWFLRRFGKWREDPVEEDPAGLGTAFGFEASLGPVNDVWDDDARSAERERAAEDSPMAWLGRRAARRN